MNGASNFSFGSVLSGISKTLGVAREVIPLWQQTKPLINNMRTAYTLIKNVNKRLLANKKISSDHLYGSQVTLFDKIPKEVRLSALDQENYLTVSLIFTIKDNQYSKNFLFRVKETEMAAPLH